MAVPADVMNPLFPSGEELRTDEESDVPDTAILSYCSFAVDDESLLDVTVREMVTETSLMEKYEIAPRAYGILEPRETTMGGFEAIIGPDGSLVQADCQPHGDGAILLVNVRYHRDWGDPDQGQALIRDFTEAYLDAAIEEFGCTGSD